MRPKSSWIGPCLTAYCHEQNFARLDRVEILAEEKGLTVAQIAMAFLMEPAPLCFPTCGAVNRRELEENIVAANTELDTGRTGLAGSFKR